MKPPVIAAPARSLAEIANAWDMLDSKEQRTIAEFRAAKTKLLIEARADPKWGARGDGFVEFVEKRLRVDYATAHRWMVDAGWKPPKQPGAGAKANHSQSENERPTERRDPKEQESDDNHVESDIEEEIDPRHYRSAFLLRADQAARFAAYSGPIDKEVISLARRSADAWSNLARDMEKRL